MFSLDVLHAIECMLRDVTGIHVPFGHKIVVFGWAFRKTLPIIPRASIKHCDLRKLYFLFNTLATIPTFKSYKTIRETTNSDDFSIFPLRVVDGDLPLKQDQPFFDYLKIPQSVTANWSTKCFLSTKFKLTHPSYPIWLPLRRRMKILCSLKTRYLHVFPDNNIFSTAYIAFLHLMSVRWKTNAPLNSLTSPGMPTHVKTRYCNVL